jgi:comEA protein
MVRRKRITKTEIFLAVLVLIFLASLLLPGHSAEKTGSGYTVSVQYQQELPEVAQEKININTATEAQLATLDGIGEVLAQRIVAWRTENGPFHAPEELMQVKGIGEKTLENIRNQIIVEEKADENTGG